MAKANVLVEYVLDCYNGGLHCLEGGYILKKNPVNIAHLPSLMLVIGYPIYWAQLLSGQASNGISSPIAWIIFGLLTVFIFFREFGAIRYFIRDLYKSIQAQDWSSRLFIGSGILLGGLIVSFAFLEATHPPHLMQESDLMNYHMSLPRQHLILGSFKHIPWSADDFFFLPIDFALAPFWFVSALPNKIPQFIFFLGLMGVIINLCRWFNRTDVLTFFVPVFALLGSHGHGVQMGTGMLDLPLCYLFLAMVDSFLRQQKWLFIVEVTFFLWAKSLVALQIVCLFIVMLIVYLIFRLCGRVKIIVDFQKMWVVQHEKQYRRYFLNVLIWIALLSVFVAGPFLGKSMYYTGTPVFPIGVGFFKNHPGILEGTLAWESLLRSAEFLTSSIHRDGYGRSMIDFLTHFWALAVPEDNVNNAFDYPMGLSYLIFLGPFLYLLIRSIQKKEFPVIPWLIVAYWALWWFSVRETRHLYTPVVLMFVVVTLSMKQWSKVFQVVLLIAMFLNTLNVYRANSSYFFKSRLNVLRTEDRRLVDLGQEYHHYKRNGYIELEQFEVAFALFPVMVRREILPHVIAF